MTTAVIIPARYDSTRFPGKPLAKISGKPMIQWVVESALRSKLSDKVIVATDDERIFDFVKGICSVLITSKDHQSGTDRIAEVVKQDPGIKYIVNLQGDEPLMPPEYIDKAIESVKNETAIVSLITTINNEEELNNSNVVKAYMDNAGFAVTFSRKKKVGSPFRHIGLYAYDRNTLLKFNSLPQSKLEKEEKLEQLRALENGIKIKLEIVPKAYPAVDTPENIKLVESILSLPITENLNHPVPPVNH